MRYRAYIVNEPCDFISTPVSTPRIFAWAHAATNLMRYRAYLVNMNRATTSTCHNYLPLKIASGCKLLKPQKCNIL